jgi:transposase
LTEGLSLRITPKPEKPVQKMGCIPVADQSTCPVCNQKTSKVHSRYNRHLADLPWADVPVSICLEVRRFFCQNDNCPRVIFRERLPGVVMPWARRTESLAKAQRAIGLALGGAAGTRLSALLMMKAGIDLLLSLIRRIAHSERPSPRVLGVDDWAKRHGQSYGTILVDLERGEIVDLLADRTAETLTQWLSERPGCLR